MNGIPENSVPTYDERINSTLRLLGSANPRPGMEQRLAARIANLPLHSPAPGLRYFFGLHHLAFRSACAILAFVAIVFGTVSHSKHLLPVAPGVRLPGSQNTGMGAVDAKKMTSRPVTPPANGRPRSTRKFSETRSAASPDRREPNGVAVPATPLPQDNPQP
jgi:hypothetical protein